MNLFGRRKIYASLKEDELTPENILKLLPSILAIHDKNAAEIDYLWRYYKGEQPILNKTKIVRPEINNKVVENHAYEIVEFKKSNDFGEPVQYVQKGEKDSEKINPEISLLNKYMEGEDKSSLDMDLSEWQCICGTSYRWVDTDTKAEEDDAPFEMSVPDPRNTFVVYSSDVKGKPLFGGTYSWFVEDQAFENNLTPSEYLLARYRVITIYTDELCIKYKQYSDPQNKNAVKTELLTQTVKVLGVEQNIEAFKLVPKGQRIIEYPMNNARLGLIELVMSQLNAINAVKSDDLDAIDQFVQSLLVFVNQDVTVEDVKELEAAGAIKIYTSDPGKPADVKLLVQELHHSETKIVTDDLYDKMLTILGIPRLNNKVSGGDTGQARLLGEGWTMAYQRAKQDDLNFKKSERRFLKLILNICKSDDRKDVDKIENLRLSDIDIKIPRDRADNMFTKAQTIQMLIQAGVHPEVAYTVVGLFSDPHDVYEKSVKYHGEDFWKGETTQTIVEKEKDGDENAESKQGNEKAADILDKTTTKVLNK